MNRTLSSVALLTLTACATSPSPGHGERWAGAESPPSAPGVREADAGGAPVASMSLTQALELADREHQDLAAWRALVRAADGWQEQAGAWPNPELIVRMENVPVNRGVGGQGSLSNQGNYIAGVAQDLPLGGRIGAAEEVTARELERERVALEVRRAEVHAAVRLAHAQAVLAARERTLRDEVVALTSFVVSVARARVAAGDATGAEVDRAELEAIEASVFLERAQAAEVLALRGLVAATGASALRVASVSGDPAAAVDVGSVEPLLALAERSPALRLARAEVEAAAARVALAQSERWPDLGVELLYRRLELTNQHSVDAGLRIGLPIFDRRAGSITARRAELDAAGARERGARTAIQQELASVYEQLVLGSSLARRLATDAIPRAERAVVTLEARWQAGDLSLADVVPSRRVLLELRLTHLEALRSVAQHTAALERLLGLGARGPER